jgi:hypothetical protein
MNIPAAAAFLDKFRPGWHNEVDADSLDMSNPGKCILGQLYGNYWDAYGLYPQHFGADYGTYHEEFDHNASESEWIAEINKRKDGVNVDINKVYEFVNTNDMPGLKNYLDEFSGPVTVTFPNARLAKSTLLVASVYIHSEDDFCAIQSAFREAGIE